MTIDIFELNCRRKKQQIQFGIEKVGEIRLGETNICRVVDKAQLGKTDTMPPVPNKIWHGMLNQLMFLLFLLFFLGSLIILEFVVSGMSF